MKETEAKNMTGFTRVLREIANGSDLQIGEDKNKKIKIFASVLVALSISSVLFVYIKTNDIKTTLEFCSIVTLVSAISPFFLLQISKSLAKKTHKVVIVNPGNFRNEDEENLYELVSGLCVRAGLAKMPELGIYDSEDMNAFATGKNKDNALIAVSTGLLNKMNEEAISAVISHEIAHILNGDMTTLAMVQTSVNMVAIMLLFPLWFFYLIAQLANLDGTLKKIANWTVVATTAVVAFLGMLVVKVFSRKREYEADRIASEIVKPGYMISALQILQNDTAEAPSSQRFFKAFKINSPQFMSEIFSTHPPLDKRIEALEALRDQGAED